MPIFTFQCQGCGQEREVICKVSERDSQAEMCTTPDCSKHGDVMLWKGVEGGTVLRPNGTYRFALIDSKGGRHVSPKAQSRGPRSVRR